MQITQVDVEPFCFKSEYLAAMADETIGHTALERHPLVCNDYKIYLGLPTSVGAAVRRMVMESAVAAGKLHAVQEILDSYQFEEIRRLGGPGWGIRPLDSPASSTPNEFIGWFDEGGHVHVVSIPDSLEETLKHGLQSIHVTPDLETARFNAVAAEIAMRPDYQRGIWIASLISWPPLPRGSLTSSDVLILTGRSLIFPKVTTADAILDRHGKFALWRKITHRDIGLVYHLTLPRLDAGRRDCHCARKFIRLGHVVRLAQTRCVRSYVKLNKNDAVNAGAICRPATRFDSQSRVDLCATKRRFLMNTSSLIFFFMF